VLNKANVSYVNKIVAAVLLGVGIASAASLVAVGQSGGMATVLFVAVGAIGTAAALTSLELGLMALIFVAATDGFLKGISPGWHTQLMKDYLLALCLLRWAWLSVLGNRRRSVRHSLSLPIVFFAGWVVVELFNARPGSFVVGLAGLRMWTIWLPVFFIAYDTIQSRTQINRIVLFLILLFIPMSAYGIVQYYIGLDHLFRLGPGFDVYRLEYYHGSQKFEWRPPSTTVQPHNFAAGLATVGLMAIGAAFYFGRHRVLQAVIIASVPLMAGALMITAVRTAAGSAVVGIIALLLVIRRVDLAVVAIVLSAIAVPHVTVLTEREANMRLLSIVEDIEYTRSRVFDPLKYAAGYALEHPLGSGIASGWGTGRLTDLQFESLRPEERSIAVENEYGRSMSELGIPGFVLFMWVLIAVTRSNLLAYRTATQRRDRWLLAGIFAACFGMLARLMTGPALYTWPEAPMFWILVAIAARLPEIERDEEMRALAPKPESRAVVLGNTELPWQRAEREAAACAAGRPTERAR
jgi:hypothetical protein